MFDEDFAVLTALFVATLLLTSPVPRAVAATFWPTSFGASFGADAIDATAIDSAPMPGLGLLPM
jgi:hypothetical protein